jgi:hypothetical protein
LQGESLEVVHDHLAIDPVSLARWLQQKVDHQFGNGFELEHFQAVGVWPNGTVHVADTSFTSWVGYTFARPMAPPDDQPPLGAGGSSVWRQIVHVTVERPGCHEVQGSALGGRSFRGSRGVRMWEAEPEPREAMTIPMPDCALESLWQQAIEQGAPTPAVASITYDADGYAFLIEDTSIDIQFDEGCRPLER